VTLARYGSTIAFVVLGVLAILFLITGHWILAFFFAAAAGASWFVRDVKRTTRR
jgi:hypothetical protein